MGWTAAAEIGGELLAEEATATVAAGAVEGGTVAAAAEGGAVAAGGASAAEGGGALTSLGLEGAGTAITAEEGATLVDGAAAAESASGAQTLRNVATILTPVASLAASASGISAARRAGGTIPRVSGPSMLPTSGSPNTIMASRAAATEQLRRRGRAATIMTAPQAETLGG